MIYYLKHNLHKVNWAMIGNVLGMVLIAQGCLMFLPVLVDLIYQEGLYDSYLIVIAICLVLGYVLTRKRARVNSYFAKDGMIAVGLAWIVLSLAVYHSIYQVKFHPLSTVSLKLYPDLLPLDQVF